MFIAGLTIRQSNHEMLKVATWPTFFLNNNNVRRFSGFERLYFAQFVLFFIRFPLETRLK